MICFGVKSALPSRQHVPRSANSRIFCSYEFSPPQLLQNLQLRKPLASADSKATLTPLDSALTDGLTLNPSRINTYEKGEGGIPPLPAPTARPAQPRVTNHRSLYAGAIIQGASLSRTED